MGTTLRSTCQQQAFLKPIHSQKGQKAMAGSHKPQPCFTFQEMNGLKSVCFGPLMQTTASDTMKENKSHQIADRMPSHLKKKGKKKKKKKVKTS